jgi:hypothetical protein
MTTPTQAEKQTLEKIIRNNRPGIAAHQIWRMLDTQREQDAKTIAELTEKLDFLKSKGLTVGKMKTSDKPEPYWVYVIEPESELCDLHHVHRSIDAEIARDAALAKVAELTKRAEELELGLAVVEAAKKSEFNKRQAAEAAVAEMRDVLDELVHIVDGFSAGECDIDSLTTQPARRALLSTTLGQGWRSPGEWNDLEAKVKAKELMLKRIANEATINGKPFGAYLHEQFPATVGHIPISKLLQTLSTLSIMKGGDATDTGTTSREIPASATPAPTSNPEARECPHCKHPLMHHNPECPEFGHH